MKSPKPKSILIIGMAGGLAKITAHLLAKKYPTIPILGVDPRPIKDDFHLDNLELYQLPYTRGNFEKLFRDKKFDIVLHLGRMSHVSTNPGYNIRKRLNLNIMGTNRILDLSLKFKIKKVIVLSTFHVYGALPDNPTFLKEDSPLRGSFNYPELRDVVEMDQMTTNWMWKHQNKIDVVVLRPCNIIGPQIKNVITKYLTTSAIPTPMDFNPMFQFIHEYDMANLITESIEKVPTGTFNVANNDVLSIREAKSIATHSPQYSLPLFLVSPLAKALNKTVLNLPEYILDYIKFPCVINGNQILKHFSKNPIRYSSREACELLTLD